MRFNKLIMSIALIALSVLLTFTITYSYFSPNINDFSASLVSTETGKFIIDFEDDNPNSSFSGVIPGSIESIDMAIYSKNFTVTGINTTGNDNTASLNMKYNLSYRVNKNDFASNDIGYILISTSANHVSGASKEFNKDNILRLNTGTSVVDFGNGSFGKTSSEGDVHSYSLYLFYIESGVPQECYDCKFDADIVLSAVK